MEIKDKERAKKIYLKYYAAVQKYQIKTNHSWTHPNKPVTLSSSSSNEYCLEVKIDVRFSNRRITGAVNQLVENYREKIVQDQKDQLTLIDLPEKKKRRIRHHNLESYERALDVFICRQEGLSWKKIAKKFDFINKKDINPDRVPHFAKKDIARDYYRQAANYLNMGLPYYPSN